MRNKLCLVQERQLSGRKGSFAKEAINEKTSLLTILLCGEPKGGFSKAIRLCFWTDNLIGSYVEKSPNQNATTL